MAEKLYKVNEAIELGYQAPGAQSDKDVRADIYKPDKSVHSVDNPLTEVGSTGTYRSSFTPIVEGTWQVVMYIFIDSFTRDSQVTKSYSVGAKNIQDIYTDTAKDTTVAKESTVAKAADLANLDGDVATLDGKVVTVDGKVDTVDSKVVAVDGKVDNVQTKVNEIDSEVDALTTQVGGMDTQLDTVETKIDAIDTKVGSLDTPPMAF